MAKHRLLISGANGFVGSVLTELARTEPHAEDVSIAALNTRDGRAIDIRDSEALEFAVADARPTAVIHLAAVASPHLANSKPDEAWAINLMGTFNLAQAVMKHARGARFIFAGSSEAYGASFAGTVGSISEDSALNPLTPYGATKASADIMLGQMARQGLKAIRFRPFNHTGPGQAASYVIPAFARQIVRIERGWQSPVMRVGNLHMRRDFLDARDVAKAYLMAARVTDAPPYFDTFNLATGKPVTIEYILERLLIHCSVSISVENDPALLRTGEMATISGDPSKTKNVFGWTALLPIEKTLRDVLDYWRNLADEKPHSISK